MIRLHEIDFFYNEKQVLFDQYNLILHDRQKVWLTGKNGSGKTTLMKILLGIFKVKKGVCSLNYNKKKTLYIPSTPFYEPYLPMSDFLLFYLNKMLQIPKVYIDLDYIYSQLALYAFQNTLCKDLSKGTIQKLMISPLFTSYDWEHVFMDEPFEHLDMPTCHVLQSTIAQLNGFVLIIHHKEHLLESFKHWEKVNL